MSKFNFFFYTGILIFFSVLFPSVLQADSMEKEKHRTYVAFSQIPILDGGRVKPLDTFARSYLMLFRGRNHIQNLSANAWLAEMLFDQRKAYKRPVFKIINEEVLRAINLNSRKPPYYTFLEVTRAIHKNLDLIRSLEAQRDKNLGEEGLGLAQRQLLALYQKTVQYYDISRSLSLILPHFIIYDETLANQLNLEKNRAYTYLEFIRREEQITKLVKNFYGSNKNKTQITKTEQALIELQERMFIFENDLSTTLFRILPPQWEADKKSWFSPWESLEKGKGSPKTAYYLNLWKKLANSYLSSNVDKWNTVSKELKEASYSLADKNIEENTLSLESFYNRIDFFYKSLLLYLISFILLIVSFLFFRNFLYIMSFSAAFIAFLLQGTGIILRILLLQRPPVSTLYESILFVTWVSMILIFFIEWKRRDKLALFTGSVLGVALQFIALRYTTEGDTLVMLRAVLETNFWLGTHVIMITIGYACCLIVGALAHIELLWQRFFSKNQEQKLYPYILGTLFLALFFSLAGTILGGVWADQSWGRFWGWDPKENGAMLIVLWLIFVLHGRFSGVLSPLLFIVSSALTTLIVMLSWFGVNLLNVGLHTYGATHDVAINIVAFAVLEIVFASFMFIGIWRQGNIRKNMER